MGVGAMEGDIIQRIRLDVSDYERNTQRATQAAQKFASTSTSAINRSTEGYTKFATSTRGLTHSLADIVAGGDRAAFAFSSLGIQAIGLASGLSKMGGVAAGTAAALLGVAGPIGAIASVAFSVLPLLGDLATKMGVVTDKAEELKRSAPSAATARFDSITGLRIDEDKIAKFELEESKRRFAELVAANEARKKAAAEAAEQAERRHAEAAEARARAAIKWLADLKAGLDEEIAAAQKAVVLYQEMEDAAIEAAARGPFTAMGAGLKSAEEAGLPPRSSGQGLMEPDWEAWDEHGRSLADSAAIAAAEAAAAAEAFHTMEVNGTMAGIAIGSAFQTMGQIVGQSVDMVLGPSVKFVKAAKDVTAAERAMQLSGSEAWQAMARDVIKSLAAQASVQAIMETGLGFAAMARAAFGDPRAAGEASMHFAAAATFAVIGAAAAAATASIGAITKRLPPSADAGGGGGRGGGGGGGGGGLGSGERGGGRQVTINVYVPPGGAAAAGREIHAALREYEREDNIRLFPQGSGGSA